MPPTDHAAPSSTGPTAKGAPLALVAAVSIAQFAVATWIWYSTVPNYEWHIVQQYYGHAGPSIFLVAMGASALFLTDNFRFLNRVEAWLAIVAGAAYVLADTFIMHPPWGVFDGAGNAEQEHVAIMGTVAILGLSGLAVLRRFPESGRGPGSPPLPTGAHFLIGVAVASIVFLGHHQHTVAGTTAHNATILLLVAAALFRVMGRITEYAMTMIVAGFVFFSSQMGFAMAMDMGGHSGGAWVALWAGLGFASATGFLLMAPR